MKVLKWLVIALVVLLVVVVVTATIFLDSIVKTAVRQAGPSVIGAPIALKDVSISLFTGKVAIEGLVIGNPPGFQTDHAISLDHFILRLKPLSLLSNKIVIREIKIDGPEITYEFSGKHTNLGRISANASGGNPPSAQKEGSQKPEPKAGKKVEIDDLTISNGRIRASFSGMGAQTLDLPLPTIHLTDIGKDSGGASVGDVVAQVLQSITEAASQALGGIGQLLGHGARAVGGAAGKGESTVGDQASKIGKELKNMFRTPKQ